VRIDGYRQTWNVDNEMELNGVLAWRDDRAGAIFWLAADEASDPTLAIRVSGSVADVHYFPREGHPGFRALGGNGLPEHGFTTLVYEGADPATGEQCANEFIVTFETAQAIAREFMQTQQMSGATSWFEL
jgi:hypothetical protein